MKNIFTKTFALTLMLLLGINSIWAAMYLPGTWNEWSTSDDKVEFVDSKLTLTLEANTTYEFKFYDNSKAEGHKWYGLSNSTMTSGNSTGWWFYYKDNGNCKIVTTYAGQYTVTIDEWVDDTSHGNDWCPVLSVAYPEVTKNTPIASNHLFGTYQEHGNTYVETNGGNPLQWGVDNYVVTCGQQILYRIKTAGSLKFDGNTWATQVRVNGTEIQATQIISNQEHRTPNTATLSTKADDVTMYFFVFCQGFQHRKTAEFTYNRYSINNPIDDEEAPTLDVANTTIEDSGENIVVTFGEVTANEEYFYYIADEEHKIAAISLDNTITIAKPTAQDGTTYNFVCCAVDYNGNMSNAKEYRLVMPFDANTNLALSGVATAGYSEKNSNFTPEKANDGDSETRWNSWGYGDDNKNWWQVELKNVYYITSIKADYRDFSGAGTTFRYEGSVDGINWQTLVSGSNPSNGLAVYEFAAKEAKYIRFSANRYATVNEFEVYAMGLVIEDTEAPVIHSATVKEESITDCSVTLQIDATDNVAVSTCNIYDATTGYTKRVDYAAEITLSDLAPGTEYHFEITVYDVAENASDAYHMDAFTTLANPHIPATAAPVPNHAQADVISLYSDTYTCGVAKANFSKKMWMNDEIHTYSEGIVDGNNYVSYLLGNNTGMNCHWAFGEWDGNTILDLTNYDYLHVDCWAEVDGTLDLRVNADGNSDDLQLKAGEWVSFDIDLALLADATDLTQVKYLKLNQVSASLKEKGIALDNVYFWKKTSHNLVVSAAGYASLYLPFAAKIPDGVEVFTGKYDADESTLTLETLSQQTVIPARTAVVVKAAEKTYTFDEEVSADKINKQNDLLGVLADTDASTLVDASHVALTLGKKDGKVGFYQPAGGIIGANKIYLIVDKPAGQTPAPVRIVMPSDVATSTENILSGEAAQKLLINGQLHIVRDGKTFDITGRIIK